jgi:phosphoglycolate phosphatase-like HAD superfamily hydrolase
MAVSGASLVWLFDVDGTLVHTEGAGRAALEAAFDELFGIANALEGVALAGRTDPLIVGDALARHGRAFANGDQERFWSRAEEHLARLLSPPRGLVLAGVRELLDAIEREPAHVRGLLTGNMRPFARLKLDAFGLFGCFAFGTYGSDGPDRPAMARVAVARAAQRWGVTARRCVVVGDTELDIDCARAAGTRVIAVATGGRSREQLAPHGPDLLLDDLTDAGAILDWTRSLD